MGEGDREKERTNTTKEEGKWRVEVNDFNMREKGR